MGVMNAGEFLYVVLSVTSDIIASIDTPYGVKADSYFAAFMVVATSR
jgi:hypothetical protein